MPRFESSRPPAAPARGRVERHVVVETVSSSSSKGTMVTFIIVAVIALVLIGWIVMQMK